MKEELIRRLQDLSEADLIGTVLVPLLRELGYERVAVEGGAFERGIDIVGWRTGEFGDSRATVVIVKRFRPTGKVGSSQSLRGLLDQVGTALESRVPQPDGEQRVPSSVLLVTPYGVQRRALESGLNKLRGLSQANVTLIDGPRLADLIFKYMPQLAAQLAGVAGEVRTEEPPAKTQVAVVGHAAKAGTRALSDTDRDYLVALYHELGHRIGPTDDTDPNLCFVVISFSGNPVLADFYEKAIKPTITDLGYRCERVDEQHFNGSIREQIFRNVRRAKFVVADMTEARPNCYYELGVAHALRKEVIHLAYSIDDVHFDVKDFNFIVYSRIDQLTTALEERVLATVGQANEKQE